MLFAIIAAIVMPLAVLLPLETQRRFEIQSEQAREGARHLAATVAIAIDRTFLEQRRLLEAAGERFDLGAAGGGNCAELLATLKALQPNAANIVLIDRGGDSVCSAVPLPPDLAQRPAEFGTELAKGMPATGEVFTTTPERPMLAVATPLRDRGGEPAGFLAMAIGTDVVQRLVVELAGGEALSVITASGVVIASARDPEQWVGRSIADLPLGRAILERSETRFDAAGLDGTERLFGVARVPASGSYVAAGLPKEETLGPVYRAMQKSLAFAALAVLGAVALAWIVAREVRRPVAGIVSAMKRAAAGASDASAPESGPLEIALIGAEFNRMIAARTRLESERQEALAEAEAHERRLREIIETIAEGVLIMGPDGRYELANRAEEELLGVPRDCIVGARYDEVPWRRAAADGSPFRLEDHPFERLARGEPALRDYVLQVVSPQGRVRMTSVNAAALRDAAGNFDGIVLTGVDITERRTAEQRLRDIIEALGEGLVLIGPDGRYLLANRAEEELLSVTRDQIIGVRFDEVPWGRLAADGSPFRVEDHPFARLVRGEPSVRDLELQLVSPQGRARTVLASAMPLRDADGNFDGAVLSAVDITERKHAERRLRETIETMAEGLAIIGADGRYEFFNRAAEELTGVPRERILGVRYDEVPWARMAADGSRFHLEDHPFARLARGEPALRDYEYQVVPMRGQPRLILTNAAPLRDAAGNFDGIVATWSDITDRKAAERRLRDIIETMAEAVVILGADGRFELVNREAEEMLMRPREHFIGVRQGDAPWVRLATDGRPLRPEELPLERLRRGEPALHNYEFQLVVQGAAPRTILVNAGPLRDAAGNFAGSVLTGVDITERKAAERRLAEYSARLGTLSRRVLTVQEEERRAVARELHDEPAKC